MTGCIDNDEPYGIEQIRLATADFLKSKKAAVEAEAAAANAQVEIEKIKAETEKLRIEAEAAIKAAQAKILEAQANKEQAEADQIKAATEAYIASQKAGLDEYIALAEIRVKDAERLYQEALYEFEKAKAENADTQNSLLYQAVVGAFDNYMTTLENYNKANAKYLMAQRAYAASLVDLKWVDEQEVDGKIVPGHFESAVYQQKALLEKNLADAQAGVARAQAQIDLNNQAIADVKANDLYAVLEKYQAQQKTNTEDIEKVKVEIEAVTVENAPLYEKQANLAQQINDAMNAPIAIAPYTYEPDANLSIPGFFKNEIEVIPEGMTYSLAKNDNYFNAQATYEYLISTITNALMDDNDKAWTQAKINEMTRELTEANTQFATDKANWELAKKVYNMGNKPDAADLYYEAEVEAAVAAYNNGASDFAALRQALVDAADNYTKASAAVDAAEEAFNGSATTAQAKYNAAVEAAQKAHDDADKAYTAAVKAAQAKYQQAYDNADETVINANRAEFRAYAEYQLALSHNNNDPEVEAVKTAKKKYDDAVTAKEKAVDDAKTAKKNADATLLKENKAAEAAKLTALHAADEALDKAHAAYVATLGADGNKEKDPEYAPVAAANEAYLKALNEYSDALDAARDGSNKNSVWELYSELRNAVDAQQVELQKINGVQWNINEIINLSSELYYYLWGNDDRDVDFPVAEAPVYLMNGARYMNAYNFLIANSQNAYGLLHLDYDNDLIYPELEDERAFLVANVTIETVDAYIKQQNPELPTYLYYTQYDMFGSFGDTLELENRIAVAKTYLNNTDIVSEVTKTLQANLDALNKGYEDAKAAVEKIQEEKDAVDLQIENLTTELNNKLEDLNKLGITLRNIISTIEKGIAKIEFPDKQGQPTSGNDGVLTTIINELNKETEKYEGYLANWNRKLEAAQYQLDQYNNGYTDIENPLKIRADYYQELLNQAQAEVNFAKARLDELQAQYDAATKKQ